ncbi:hypothetical protein PMIN01_00973 [Paraphaeosphaeria minitans]|uniref:Uncharacterized protein n=1 Tax=Paraphaeosphaeria minitans TaxID=565426 RepID=A0A9P6GTT5_9PLEO|nr:hypothetical protein PMIN01_00973 [Paraphaeosphaeria minitans]
MFCTTAPMRAPPRRALLAVAAKLLSASRKSRHHHRHDRELPLRIDALQVTRSSERGELRCEQCGLAWAMARWLARNNLLLALGLAKGQCSLLAGWERSALYARRRRHRTRPFLSACWALPFPTRPVCCCFHHLPRLVTVEGIQFRSALIRARPIHQAHRPIAWNDNPAAGHSQILTSLHTGEQ